MRLFLLCNVFPETLAKRAGIAGVPINGWLWGMIDGLIKADKEIHITVCAPFDELISVNVDKNLSVRSFIREKAVETFVSLFKKEPPDIIYISGTEFKHAYYMTEACRLMDCLNRVLIGIQGLVSIYSHHYYAGLPEAVVKGYSLRDIIRRENIVKQRKKFALRGEYEIKAIRNCPHIAGRTDWDKACAEMINPQIEYHFCNEILRDEFYTDLKWDYSLCNKYSIFLSQWYYPIKGFHMLLHAMPEILKRYPDARIITTGNNPLERPLRKKLRQTYYHKYIIKLIKQYKLGDKIVFRGVLSAEEMRQEYLNCNVFVSPSAIENSPNSVGEAMILGVPIVASDVGGVKNLLKDKHEGYIYPFNEFYMISFYINKIFEAGEGAESMGGNAIRHAKATHDKMAAANMMYSICNKILSNEKQTSGNEVSCV